MAEKINKDDDNKIKEYAIKILRRDKTSIADINCFLNKIKILKELSKKKSKYVSYLYGHGEGFILRDGKVINEKRSYLVIIMRKKRFMSLLILYIFSFFKLFKYLFYLKKTSDGFKEEYAQLIFKKILEAIQFCHDAKICHLDIKEDNILLDENFDPIITDFGLSIKIEGKEAILQHGRGSPSYAAPEMYVKGIKKINFKADIFSLGVLLFRLVTKNWGFKTSKTNDKEYNSISIKHFGIYWNGISKRINIEKLSKEFKDLYFKMVTYNPDNRLTIEKIYEHPWMKKIIDLKREEYNKLEMEVFTFI